MSNDVNVNVVKLVIIGDSLPLPRVNDGVLFEQTYPAVLQKELSESVWVINRSKRANTSRKVALPNNLADDIKDFKPDILIYHIGIVDCAPRLFTEFEQKVLERIPSLVRKRIIKYFASRRYFFTKKFPKVYVDKNSFIKHVRQTIGFAKEFTGRILIIGICNSNKAVISKSFSFTENVTAYNNELKKISTEFGTDFLDVNVLLDPATDLLPDGIHYNNLANRKIALAILDKLKLAD